MPNNIDKQLIRQARTLAHKECANYQDGICIPEDRPCYVINQRYSSVHDGAIDCDYFMSAVLPLDREMTKAVWTEIYREEGVSGEGMKTCVRCSRPFVPGSNRQRYCAACGETAKKTRSREKQRRYRHRQKAAS